MIFARKINKILEFLPEKCPIFTQQLPEKYFFRIFFLGGGRGSCPLSPTPMPIKFYTSLKQISGYTPLQYLMIYTVVVQLSETCRPLGCHQLQWFAAVYTTVGHCHLLPNTLAVI